MPLRRRWRVACLIETSNAYGRGLLEGIVDFVQEHEAWSIYLPEQGRGAQPPEWLRTWRGDGVIARIENAEVAACVAACDLPAIDVSAARLIPDAPWVETNDEAFADLAFAHLEERGFRSFAFVGDDTFNWSRWRGHAFAQRVHAAGHSFRHIDVRAVSQTGSWDAQQNHLAAWINELPRPTGIWASYDILAQQLLDACRRVDVAVPEEVAVLGTDNDELLCRLSDPPLSSVIPDTRRTGHLAAQLLEARMQGRHVETRVHRVSPLGVHTRQSTDVLAVEDAMVADALRFIREQASGGIGVADVLARTKLSRRVFEARFRRVVGRSPHEELLRVRMARIKTLLIETELSVAQIAECVGYVHVEYLSAQFTREVGVPPSVFRGRHRQAVG